jgi:hypothetical protein
LHDCKARAANKAKPTIFFDFIIDRIIIYD